MASSRDVENAILQVNEVGRENLRSHGIDLPEDSSTLDIVNSIGAMKPLQDQIDENRREIDSLKGEGQGSVSEQISKAISKLIDTAPEAYDTLKEIAEYIQQDKEGAADLVTKINDLANKVNSTKDEIIGTDKDSSSDLTINGLKKYIDENSRQTITAGEGLKVTTSEDKSEVKIEVDDEITFIFDCGTSEEVTSSVE